MIITNKVLDSRDSIIIFSTGKRLFAGNSHIGIDKGSTFVTHSFGGEALYHYGDSSFLTPDEKQELSEYMIERWKKFAEPI